jgi:hypothetical protein
LGFVVLWEEPRVAVILVVSLSDGSHGLIVIWDGFVAEVVKGDGDSCAQACSEALSVRVEAWWFGCRNQLIVLLGW